MCTLRAFERLITAIVMFASLVFAANAQTCPKGYKAAAGTCVQTCPGGYEDRGQTCVFPKAAVEVPNRRGHGAYETASTRTLG